MSKIEKTLARQRAKIAEGQFYEAHQQLRVIASRYIKSSQYGPAADILSSGAIALLKADQGGSGGDLAMMLMTEVYSKTEEGFEGDKKVLVEILRAFPAGESTRKRFAQEVVGWSAKENKEGEVKYPQGDPELHHVVGVLYAEDNEPYEAERHLTLGTDASAEVLARLEYAWYTSDESHTAALYASRCVFPYLLVGNLKAANKAFLIFTSTLGSSNPGLFTQSVSTTRSDMRVYPSLPLLNFIGLLLLAVQRGVSGVYKELCKHYVVHIKEVGIWDDALAQIGEAYFGIKIPRQGNPLFDMMGSMFFGGGGGGGGGTQSPKPGTPKPQAKPAEKKAVEPPPPAMDLD